MRAFVSSLLLLGAACATSSDRPRLGQIDLRPYTRFADSPTTFSVQQGRILSPSVDAVVDPDGCIRGSVAGSPLEVCGKAAPAPLDADGKVERWAGPTGDFTIELSDGGKKLRMDGWIAGPRGQIPMHATVPLGDGPQWDELRKHPALLAIAAAAAGVEGEPPQSQGSGR